jgi:hypothetical protein
VTRETRPKKPSSSRSFAREARRSWGLKTELFFFSLFKLATFTKKKIFFFFFERPRLCLRGQQTVSAREEGGEFTGGGRRGMSASADG